MAGPKRRPRRPVKGYQRCSLCDARGHNARNPDCPERKRMEASATARALDALADQIAAQPKDGNGEVAKAVEIVAAAARDAAKKAKP